MDEIKKEREEEKRPPTSAEYDSLAKYHEENGDYEKAEEAKRMSDLSRQREMKELQEMKQQTELSQKEFKAQWNQTIDNVLSQPEYKELQNPESDMGKKVTEILHRDQRLSQVPDGFALAAHIAKGELAESSLAGKDKTISELKQEIENLNKKMSLTGSSANTHNPNPSRRPMSMDQEFESLLMEARREDSIAGVT